MKTSVHSTVWLVSPATVPLRQVVLSLSGSGSTVKGGEVSTVILFSGHVMSSGRPMCCTLSSSRSALGLVSCAQATLQP